MKIVGVLAWYDESPSWLATAVAGFGRVCDEIVAVDGAYTLYPGGRARSRPDQAEAVLQAAEAAGVGCTVHRPSVTFDGNEVEKRNLCLSLAAPFLTLMEDWVLVFDADCHVMQAYPDIVRSDLEQTDLHVATWTWLDGQDMLADPGVAELARTIDVDTEWTHRVRHIYRAIPDLAYGPTHYSVSGTVDGETVWLRGAPIDQIQPALHLGKALVAHHRRASRAKVRQDAQAGYLATRDLRGVEAAENKDMLVA